jgi:DNA replication protein DnaD
MEGWIKLHRKIRSNPVFNDLQLCRLWMICLLEASHKQREQPIGRQVVLLESGQFITGRFDLHAMYNNGLKRSDHVAEYTVWRWLQTLERQGLVSINSSNKYSIVSVLNWSFYQNSEQQNEQLNEQQMSSKCSTNEQLVSTNKNVKNDKNVENEKKKDMYSHEFESFWNEYPRKIGKKECFKTFSKNLKDGEMAAVMIKCAINYRDQCKRLKTEIQYIKHPKSFLNEERFKDYLEGGNGNEEFGRNDGSQTGGSQTKSEYAHLDDNEPFTGELELDPSIL